MILFRFRRILRSYGLGWHLKILFEYNVPPLIIRVKTYTLRKKLLLSYQKEKITIFSSNIAKKAKIGFFFLFQWRVGTWRYYPNELKMDWYAYYDLEQLLATITCQVSKIIFFAPPYCISWDRRNAATQEQVDCHQGTMPRAYTPNYPANITSR